MSDIKTRLADARLLTLTGVGGCGKTRLALEVARAVLDRYPDGVWLVELASLADPALVPYSVAGVVGCRESAGQSTVSALAAHLRGRCLLLVLDNCEHLLDACARLVNALLRGCSDVKVLATSREPLGLTGEIGWRVPSLLVPDPQHLSPLPELRQNPSVQLFAERAASARAHFVLTERNAPAVAQICQRLDGIPLALELGAARMEALTAEQLAARLDQRFRLLTGGSRVTLPRQQTLRATLDWSYDLLSESERCLFNRLSVFAGGWTLEAAEAICAGGGIAQEDVLDLLSQLVGKSLVVAQEGSDGAERYRLLETLRQYALERLTAAGEEQTLRRQHATYFLALEEGLNSDPNRPTRWVRWADLRAERLDQLEREQDNLRAALRVLIDSADAEHAVRVAQALFQIGDIRGSTNEGHAWLQQLLAVPAVADTPAARERILPLVGELAARHGDYATALSAFHELLATHKSTGDVLGVTNTLSWLAGVHLDQGNYTQARAYLEESQTVGADSKDEVESFWWRYRGGGIAFFEGRFDDARRLFEEAMAFGGAAGHSGHLGGWCEKDLGLVALEQGAYPEARSLLEHALKVGEEFGDRNLLAYSLEGFSGLATVLEQHERAVSLAGAIAALREALGNPRPLSWQRIFEHRLDVSRAALKEAATGAAWTMGHAMSLEEAVGYARESFQATVGTSKTPQSAQDRLTRREQEVAALVAEGLTNVQIAERLVITRRTVAAHVEHILNKLGFASRHQVAAWAAEHSLPN